MKRMMIALLLLAVSLPVVAADRCPCYTSLQLAGTCLRFLDEYPGVRTVTFETGRLLVCASDSMEFWAKYEDNPGSTFGAYCITGIANARNPYLFITDRLEDNLSEDEYNACVDELNEAAELLGINP